MFSFLLDLNQLDFGCLEELLCLRQFLTKPVVLLAEPFDLRLQLVALCLKGAEIARQNQ